MTTTTGTPTTTATGRVEPLVRRDYRVTGMTCDHCRRAITAGVSAVPGVTAVEVDVATGSLTVIAARTLDEVEVAAAIHDAGYDLQP